jgi:regulator of sirC expression with transglutaminase-like and TPR domain
MTSTTSNTNPFKLKSQDGQHESCKPLLPIASQSLFRNNGKMNLDLTLQTLAHDPTTPLEVAEVALYLARDEFPNLDVEAHLSELAAMGHEASGFVRGDFPARVHGLCRYLFHELGFHGNDRNYYDPQNSYLNQVLERRTGIPISLSAITMAVGRRAGLEVVGVGLPGHFVVKVIGGTEEKFIDPFHGGRIISFEECAILVEKATGHPFQATTEALEPSPPGLILQRMLNNLKGIYLGQKDFARAVRVMERLFQLQPADPSQRRDLGVGYLQTGQPGKAIDHLQAYLTAHPHAPDIDTVQEVLNQAHKSLAPWN